MPNRLANETSPYLLQHKDNPVDWCPWGSAALERAVREDKPILVSIGYSACHWCHVMAHESFEDPAIAELINQDFVAIKVDREERPEIDAVYMSALQAMSGGGGWPMNVFITPDGIPFYGGTYWPPTDRRGMPGFPAVLNAVSSAWANDRQNLVDGATRILTHLRGTVAAIDGDSPIPSGLCSQALKGLEAQFDETHGGFGGAPKFPQASVLEFLLRHDHATGDGRMMLTTTLDHMAAGGIYDHLGGGFARYSVDAEWLVPHFEKMLYDNGQLISVYLGAWKLTGSARFRRVVEETAAWLIRDMQSPAGGFYSALDADSEGVEGKFYVWSTSDLDELLTPEEADLLALHYGVTSHGNFEGANILSIVRTLDEIANQSGRPVVDLVELLSSAQAKLLAARSKRIPPGLDDKIVVSWNGITIGALADAGAALKDPTIVNAAVLAADHILRDAMRSDGHLARTLKGADARGNAVLEDYALLADGLVRLYVATGTAKWLDSAGRLLDHILAHFSHENGVGFHDTSDQHEALIIRPRDLQDGAMPCGTSVTADLLVTFAAYRQDESLATRAERIVGGIAEAAGQYPTAFGRFLAVAERLQAGTRELVLTGASSARNELARVVALRYEPSTIVAFGGLENDARLPMTADRPLPSGADAAAYLCRDYVCLAPVTTPGDVTEMLEAPTSS